MNQNRVRGFIQILWNHTLSSLLLIQLCWGRGDWNQVLAELQSTAVAAAAIPKGLQGPAILCPPLENRSAHSKSAVSWKIPSWKGLCPLWLGPDHRSNANIYLLHSVADEVQEKQIFPSASLLKEQDPWTVLSLNEFCFWKARIERAAYFLYSRVNCAPQEIPLLKEAAVL